MATTVLLAGALHGRLAPARAALDSSVRPLAPARAALDSSVRRLSPSDYELAAFRSTPGVLHATAESTS